MKFAIPEISWHNRDPVLSVDFQTKCGLGEPLRLATGGTDSHVLIWYLLTSDSGSINLEVVADLARHQKAVNVVRWSPSGQYLASGDDESIIFVWKQKTDKEAGEANNMDQGEEEYKETWVIYKTLRGHMEDVLDLSWSPNSLQIASGSVDNKLILWDVDRGRYSTILSDHKGFVQGVAWDPKGQILASASTDRVFRTFDITTKKVNSRSSKATLPFPVGHPFHEVKVRLFHDDTLQTYYRRLQFSPDGLLLAVPAGKIEPEQGKVDTKPLHAVYIYTRYSLKVPSCILPCSEPSLVTRWSPLRYKLRPQGPPAAFPMPYRMVLAVASKRSVILYDTQQKSPIAHISNIHYTRLTDLTWSPDGLTLVASSTDGFCSVISFTPAELGEVMTEEPVDTSVVTDEQIKPDEVAQETVKEKSPETKPEKKSSKKSIDFNKIPKIDAFMKFKTPRSNAEKSPKKQKINAKQEKTPVKIDLLVDTARPSWSENSSNDIIRPKDCEPMDVDVPKNSVEMIEIEDSEDMKLVYEESVDNTMIETRQSPRKSPRKSTELQKVSPMKVSSTKTKKNDESLAKSENSFFKQAKVTDVKDSSAAKNVASPKAPRRVSFVTLSSLKNAKKN